MSGFDMGKDLIRIGLAPISEQQARFGTCEALIHDALKRGGQLRFWPLLR